MSAHFFLKYRAHWIRLVRGREDTAELVFKPAATPFTSEAEAWSAAHRLELEPEFCEVQS